MSVEQSVEWEFAGETEVLKKTFPSATLSTTNPTWPDLGSNPGRRDGKPVTNRVSCGTASNALSSEVDQDRNHHKFMPAPLTTIQLLFYALFMHIFMICLFFHDVSVTVNAFICSYNVYLLKLHVSAL
jgi:hypothetical protein